MSYFDPYFSSKLGKMYSVSILFFDPFFTLAMMSIPIRNLTESPLPGMCKHGANFTHFTSGLRIVSMQCDNVDLNPSMVQL